MKRTTWFIALAVALCACTASTGESGDGGLLAGGTAGSGTRPLVQVTTMPTPTTASTAPATPPPAPAEVAPPAPAATAAPTGATQSCGDGQHLDDADADSWGDCVADVVAVNTWAAEAAAEAIGLPQGTPCAYPASVVVGQTAAVTCNVVNFDASEGTWTFSIGADSSISDGPSYVETKAAPPTLPPTTLPAIRPLISSDPRFGTCKEAKSHGYGPYYSGEDVEYDWYRDADSDGKVCE
jgi:hypothetical protein